MQIIDKRYFSRCNFDDADEFLEAGDYRSAINVIVNTVKSGDGTVESIPGNINIFDLAEFTLPVGTNKCIGAYSDELNNRIFWFNYNSNSDHSIYSYTYSTGAITTIIINSNLTFSLSSPINSIELVANLLSWTDGLNEPRQINITTDFTAAQAAFDPTSDMERFMFEFIKRPPTFPLLITDAFDSDPSSDKNNLRNISGQFTYRYVYKDFQNSTWCSVSPFFSCAYRETNTFDTVVLAFDPNRNFFPYSAQLGFFKYFIRYIDVAFRSNTLTTSESNAPFKLIKRFDLSTISEIDLFKPIFFKNDQSYPIIDETDTDKAFDSVPLLSEAMTFAKNRISFGNNLEGYDQVPFFVTGATQGFISIEELFNDPEYRTNHANFLGFKNNSKYQVGIIYKDSAGRKSSVYTVPEMTVNVPADYWVPGQLIINNGAGNPVTTIQGWKQWLLEFSIASAPPSWATSYEIVRSENQTVAMFIQGVANGVQYISGYNTDGTPIIISKVIGYANENRVVSFGHRQFLQYKIERYTCLYKDLPSPGPAGKPSDAAPPPYTGYIYENGVDANGNIIVRVKVEHPPAFPNSYTNSTSSAELDGVPIGITQGGTSIYWSGYTSIPPQSGIDINGNPITDYLPIGLENAIDIRIDIYNWNNNTSTYSIHNVTQPSNNTPYVFATGDFVNIYYRSDGTYLGILDQQIKGLQEGRYLVIPYKTEYITTTPMGVGTFIEVVTPRPNDQTVIFYETGLCYPINNGVHQPTNKIWWGDIHYMNQVPLYAQNFSYNTGTNYFISFFSMNPNPFTRAGYWERADGRPNIVNINGDKQLKRTTIFRYSNKYIEDSKVNGLCSFDEFNQIDVPNDYGPIRRLIGFDTLILFVNERKPSTAYIEQATFQNANGDLQVLLTDTYVNNPRKLDGDLGCHHPESVFKYGSEAYWFSTNKGCHAKYNSFNGVDAISNQHKARTYFLAKGVQYASTGFIPAGLDPTYKTALIAFPDQNIGYNYSSESYIGFYDYIPDRFAYVNTDMFTFKNGILWKHNANTLHCNFYGIQNKPSLNVVFNQAQNDQKIFNNIEEESNVIWNCPQITTSQGQISRLIEDDFEFIENVYDADILGDYSTSPTIEDGLYYSGSLMTSNVLKINFESDSTTLSRVKFLTLYSQINQRTNK